MTPEAVIKSKAVMLARQPEKRKVGSSTLPLTTRSDEAILPFTCASAIFSCTQSLPASARPGPFKTDYGRSLVHVECT